MSRSRIAFAWLASVAISAAPAAAFGQVVSGPKDGDETAALKVIAATGDEAGKEIDAAAAARDGKQSVFVFVQKETFSRPIGRFLRILDEELVKRNDGTRAVVVWLTDDVDAGKEYLPRVQQSIDLQSTAWTIHPGDPSGPPEWGINDEAHVTAVISRDKKVAASLAWRSINDTDVPTVLEKLSAVK